MALTKIKTSGIADDEYDEDTHEGAMGLRYSQMIAPMIKAIQELSAKVTALENAQ